jgi:hypothetical protein
MIITYMPTYTFLFDCWYRVKMILHTWVVGGCLCVGLNATFTRGDYNRYLM